VPGVGRQRFQSRGAGAEVLVLVLEPALELAQEQGVAQGWELARGRELAQGPGPE